MVLFLINLVKLKIILFWTNLKQLLCGTEGAVSLLAFPFLSPLFNITVKLNNKPRDNILNDIETRLVTIFEPSQSKGLVNRLVKREMRASTGVCGD